MFKLITVLVTLMILEGELTYCADIDDEEVTNRPVDLKVALSVNKNAVCSWDNIKNYETLYTFETSESSANPEDTPLENLLASECINHLNLFKLEKLDEVYNERSMYTESRTETSWLILKWSHFLMDYANDFYSKHKTDGQSLYEFMHPLLLGEDGPEDKTKFTCKACLFPKRRDIDVRDMLNPGVNGDVKNKLKQLVGGSELHNLAIEKGRDGPCILGGSEFLSIHSPLEALFKFLRNNSHVKSIVLDEQEQLFNLYSFSLIHHLCRNIRYTYRTKIA